MTSIGGLKSRVTSTSSQAMTERSSGRRTPRSVSATRMPTVSRLCPIRRAVGRSADASSCRAASSPPSRPGSALRTSPPIEPEPARMAPERDGPRPAPELALASGDERNSVMAEPGESLERLGDSGVVIRPDRVGIRSRTSRSKRTVTKPSSRSARPGARSSATAAINPSSRRCRSAERRPASCSGSFSEFARTRE